MQKQQRNNDKFSIKLQNWERKLSSCNFHLLPSSESKWKNKRRGKTERDNKKNCEKKILLRTNEFEGIFSLLLTNTFKHMKWKCEFELNMLDWKIFREMKERSPVTYIIKGLLFSFSVTNLSIYFGDCFTSS